MANRHATRTTSSVQVLPANHQGQARIPIPQNWVIYFLVFPNTEVIRRD
jgi:hypothetical protein